MSKVHLNEIWIFAEQMNHNLIPVYKELLCKATELAAEIKDSRVCIVIMGKCSDEIVKQLKKSGCDKIYIADHEKLAVYDSENYASMLEQMIHIYKPDMLIIGATARGSEIAPTVAAKCKTGLAAHCIDIKLGENKVNCMVPAFGGRVVSEIYIPDTRPIMASVRPGILTAYELETDREAEVIYVDTSCMDSYIPCEELITFEPAVSVGRKLEEADIVVCAGKGVDQEAWEHLKELASHLNAGIGYTRSFADMKLVPDESNMIGTSGKSVKPEVYIGFGISGAAHHVCGMNKSKLIISIDNDEKSKMFDFSNYGAVADADEMICALLDIL